MSTFLLTKTESARRRILFTGASSFTGYWFVKSLAERGHEVVATFRGKRESYTGTRKARVEGLSSHCQPVFECTFGSHTFLELIESYSTWDVLCHHAAEVTHYKSLDFDYMKALQSNTLNLLPVLRRLQQRGCQRVVLTGTVFEQDEGRGTDRGAVYPYALSKGLTYQVFRYYTEKLRLPLAKFIIANPFGPYEEGRFTSYLVNCWRKGETPTVATPEYIRDNIHVSLLAQAYRSLVEQEEAAVLAPSGYVESQGAFATRFAKEIGKRLLLPCPLHLATQTEFPEPRVRVNSDPVRGEDYGWNEKEAWDTLANHLENETTYL